MMQRKLLSIFAVSLMIIVSIGGFVSAQIFFGDKEFKYSKEYNSDGQSLLCFVVRENDEIPGYIDIEHIKNSKEITIETQNLKYVRIDLETLLSENIDYAFFGKPDLETIVSYIERYLMPMKISIKTDTNVTITESSGIIIPLVVYLDAQKLNNTVFSSRISNEKFSLSVGIGTHLVEIKHLDCLNYGSDNTELLIYMVRDSNNEIIVTERTFVEKSWFSKERNRYDIIITRNGESNNVEIEYQLNYESKDMEYSDSFLFSDYYVYVVDSDNTVKKIDVENRGNIVKFNYDIEENEEIVVIIYTNPSIFQRINAWWNSHFDKDNIDFLDK